MLTGEFATALPSTRHDPGVVALNGAMSRNGRWEAADHGQPRAFVAKVTSPVSDFTPAAFGPIAREVLSFIAESSD